MGHDGQCFASMPALFPNVAAKDARQCFPGNESRDARLQGVAKGLVGIPLPPLPWPQQRSGPGTLRQPRWILRTSAAGTVREVVILGLSGGFRQAAWL